MRKFIFIGCGTRKQLTGQGIGKDALEVANKIKDIYFKGKIHNITYTANRADAYYRNGVKAFIVLAK